MNARLLLVTGMILAGAAPLCAEETAAPAIATSASTTYPEITCTSIDGAACADTLQLASDTREELTDLLKLGPTWRFPVHIHVLTPDDPLTAKINREASQVFVNGSTMRIEAVVPVDDPGAREFVQRQFVVALLWERFFVKTAKFDGNTRLDVVPLWLVEGLREWLNKDPSRNRESIAWRAVQNKTAPSLEEITSWRELSDDRLLGLWQRAFSYYLADSLVREGERRDDFQQWLDSFATPGDPGHLHFPTETNWQRELADAAARGHSLIYTWEETADAFAADQTITYAVSKTAPVQTCTLDTVGKMPGSPALLQAVQERIFILTDLELRAQQDWRPILAAYRFALTALLQKDRARQAGKLFAEADAIRRAEAANHQKMVDYLNWFEVTRDFAPTASRFNVYFDSAKAMDRAQADPAHPNPIRASLLQVESQL